eukprot:1443188-Rhodomonas_salina.1
MSFLKDLISYICNRHPQRGCCDGRVTLACAPRHLPLQRICSTPSRWRAEEGVHSRTQALGCWNRVYSSSSSSERPRRHPTSSSNTGAHCGQGSTRPRRHMPPPVCWRLRQPRLTVTQLEHRRTAEGLSECTHSTSQLSMPHRIAQISNPHIPAVPPVALQSAKSRVTTRRGRWRCEETPSAPVDGAKSQTAGPSAGEVRGPGGLLLHLAEPGRGTRCVSTAHSTAHRIHSSSISEYRVWPSRA